MGKDYYFSTWELIVSKLSNNTKNESENETKTNYFCSELVASLYMNLGILDKKIPSKNYLPGSFSSDANIEFLNEASLGLEYIIDFNL